MVKHGCKITINKLRSVEGKYLDFVRFMYLFQSKFFLPHQGNPLFETSVDFFQMEVFYLHDFSLPQWLDKQ